MALAELGIPATIYAGGIASPGGLPASITWPTRSLDFSVDLAPPGSVPLLIHHGGLGSAQAALLAGVPQLALPVGLEQHITGRLLTEAAIGGFISAARGTLDRGRIARAVLRLRDDPALRDHARRIALGIGQPTPDITLDTIVRCCCHLAGS